MKVNARNGRSLLTAETNRAENYKKQIEVIMKLLGSRLDDAQFTVSIDFIYTWHC